MSSCRPAREVARIGIRTLAPGRYPRACEKGHGAPCKDAPPLILQHDAIEQFTFESSSRVFYWQDGILHAAWLTD